MENNALPEFERANVGDFVKFGRYPQESGNEPQPVEWQVLSKENGRMLVISRYVLDARRFDVSSNDWGKSEIRKWLNGKFYKSTFSGEEKARITRIKSFNHDNVFLLSDEEAEKYLNRDARKCKPTSYAKAKGAETGFLKLIWDNGCGYWWLCSPNPNNSGSVCCVTNNGDFINFDVDRDTFSVRPALWINLESCRSEIRKSSGSSAEARLDADVLDRSEIRKSSGSSAEARLDADVPGRGEIRKSSGSSAEVRAYADVPDRSEIRNSSGSSAEVRAYADVPDSSEIRNSSGSSAEARAYADVPDRSEIRRSSGSNPFKNANVGDFVKFGRYWQEPGNEPQPVEWQVLSKENGQMLVISRYCLDAKRFDGSSNDWGDSEIRKWLNGEFYNESFSAEEKALIKFFNHDNVFLLSKEEAEKYFADDDARKCKPTSYAKVKGAWTGFIKLIWDNGCGDWWLRSPGPNNKSICYVCNFGYVCDGSYVSNDNGSVRPALWINLESYCSEIRKSSGSNSFKNANVGDYVEFGCYPQTEAGEVWPVEWQVLSKENGRMLVISRYGLDAKRFDGSSNNWGISEIRKWLNGEFYKGAFAAEEKARIKSFNQDNVFLLSKEEAEKYFANNFARRCNPTSYAKAKGALEYEGYCFWWLCSPYPYNSDIVFSVNYYGDVNYYYDVSNNIGSVRPALWINLESYGSSAEARTDADVPDLSEIRKSSGSNPFKNANVGDFVKFGRYPQESGNEPQPVEWQVLSKENGQMLVISRYGLDSRRFDGSSNNWGNSKIRKWLNGEFYNGSFAYDEKALIKSFNRDNVFLLSREEAEKYFANRGARICKPTSYAKAKGAWIWKDGCGYWWLRSPSPSGSANVFSVRRDGDVRSNGVLDDDVSVRPALWIKVDGVEQDCKEAKGPAALGNAEAKEKMERNGNPFRNAKVGDFVKFGRYPQESGNEPQPVEWQVLSKENGRMLVISRYGLDAKRFDESSNNWGISEIRKWLNGEFYNGSFASEEKARIKSFNQDNVFLLSEEEAEKYFANSYARKCKPTSYAKAKGAWTEDNGCCYWWLRSPNFFGSDSVRFVEDHGLVYFDYCHKHSFSVRPALWINIESYGSSAEARVDADVPDFSEIHKSLGSNPFKNANVGDFVKFGHYPQESGNEPQPVEWQVLSKENGQMLVISRYGLDSRRFDGSSNNWGNSKIRKWLNGEFYNGSFFYEEKARIKSFNQDNVFLLSEEEAEKYLNSDARKCKTTSYAKAKGAWTEDNGCGYWWLRSPYPSLSSYVCSVNDDGDIGINFVDDINGSVRPALLINLES